MGYDAVEFFSEKFAKEGGDMLEGEVFESSEMDMRNKITRVMDGNPDFIIVVGRGSAMINALRQIRELNSDIPIISNNTVDIPMVWKALGDHGNNIWFSRPFADINSKMYLKSNERFKTKYGRDMNWLNIYGISIASYLVRGLKVSSGDPVKMLEFLQTLNIESIRGTLFMNKDADVVMPHTVYQRKNGQSIPVGEGVFLEKPE
jgi:ABC-type branched-subunit amino acid transport system substrate-binding protein